MSNKLLKKMLSNSASFTKEEILGPVEQEIKNLDLYESILDNLSEGHIILDRDGYVKYYNRTIFSLVPISKAHGIEDGKKISNVIIDKDMRMFILDIIDGKQKPEPKDFTLGDMSEIRTIRFEFMRLKVEDEYYLDVIIKDISETIRKETRLRRTESLASMTTMAAGIAHDIKNPLAAMKIHLQLMQNAIQKNGSINEATAEKYLSVIEEEIEHLNSIAVDFLYAVKPMNTELRLGSINEIIEDLISFLEPEAENRNIEIKCNLDSFIPRVEIDGKFVRQAFLNLVQNAFAAMESGGILSIRTRLQGNFIEVRFADNGYGIPEDKISKIFEPYFTTKATGTGLGLTTVYKIMKEHNGDISVKSEVGRGTAFTLAFPVPASERIAIEEGV